MSADNSRLFITIALFSLAVVCVFAGAQFVLILVELRKTVQKMNKILDDAGKLSESVSKPVMALSGIISGIKEGSSALKKILKS